MPNPGSTRGRALPDPVTQSESVTPWPRLEHARLRSIVLPNRKVVFVPMPKGGCTSILWLLADVAGYRAERFHASAGAEVSPAMTIHDISLWPDRFQWAKLSEEQREDVAADPTWFRFTTVRHPAARLWSAWQSKLLLREPSFDERFADSAWFPRVPTDPRDIVQDFRSFVRALADDQNLPVDVHWAPQAHILREGPPLTYIGRTEASDETLRRLGSHLGSVVEGATLPRENRSLLRYDPNLYDPATAQIVNDVYTEDFETFDYPPLEVAALRDVEPWLTEAAGLLPGVEALIARHERLATLQQETSEGTPFL